MSTPYTSDRQVPVKRLQLDPATGVLVDAPKRALFLRGPISMEWLGRAAQLPGKTLHVAVALQWLRGMTGDKPFKLTQKALDRLWVSRDAASDGLSRLEREGLIRVERKAGQRPTIWILAGDLKRAA